MLRSSAIALVGLLFLATGLVTAALFTQSFSARYLALGLLLGQIVLACAAVVLVRGMLALRLMFLALVLLYATTWICLTSFLSPLQVALPLIGAALFSSAWCAALQLFGWQVIGLTYHKPLANNDDDRRRGQFSLATILLITMIVAVYLGLLRASGLTWANGLEFLVICVLLVIPGCLLLHATAQARWAWLTCVIVISMVYLSLAGLIGYGVLDSVIALVIRALTAQLFFISVALAVLRVAGIRLGMSQTPAREHHGRDLSPRQILAPNGHLP